MSPDVWIIDLLILLIKASWLVCVAHIIFLYSSPKGSSSPVHFYQKLFYLTRCQAPECSIDFSSLDQCLPRSVPSFTSTQTAALTIVIIAH